MSRHHGAASLKPLIFKEILFQWHSFSPMRFTKN